MKIVSTVVLSKLFKIKDYSCEFTFISLEIECFFRKHWSIMFSVLTKLYSLVLSQQWKCFPFCLGLPFRDDGLNQRSYRGYSCSEWEKSHLNGNLTSGAQAPVLGDSIFHH